MKFSIFFEIEASHPTPDVEQKLYRECLEQSILAEELGYHCVWVTEHHGLYELSCCSAPEVFLSFVAARTKKIRVGHAIVLLPKNINHPIRVAERAAVLDILSNGRLNLGVGRGAGYFEPPTFG